MFNTRSDVLIKLENDLIIRNYAGTTKHRYNYICNMFLSYMEKTHSDKNINEYDEYDVISFLNYLVTERQCSDKTYNNVNSILKFLLSVTYELDINKKRLPSRRIPDKLKVIPSYDTIKCIIDNTVNKKHKIWYMLAYGSGLRSIEIAKLKVKNIDAKNNKIVVSGKGGKEKITTLSNDTLKLLREYAVLEGIKGRETYLFKGQTKEYIDPATIASSLKNIINKLHLNENITPMAFRRSFATHMLRDGVELQIVKELMGHKSIVTTSGYIVYVTNETKIKSPLDKDI